MAFSAAMPSGVEFVMDTHPDYGGQKLGPTPFEAFVATAAGCSAIDVMIVLEKKKQKVTSYKIEVSYERDAPEGAYPRPITGVTVKHIVKGEDLDEKAVAKAVELSDTKYCSVIATLREPVKVQSTFAVESTVAA